jgi:hypothetical protein
MRTSNDVTVQVDPCYECECNGVLLGIGGCNGGHSVHLTRDEAEQVIAAIHAALAEREGENDPPCEP